MSIRSTRNLQYINQTRSQTWIANQTGIPRSTVGFVLRGERTLPSKYSLNARRIYQTEVYRNLKSAGMSANQATRFKWYAPEAVGLKTSIMKEIVKESTLLRIGQKITADKKKGIISTIEDYWKDTTEEVKDAYRKSDSTYDDWIEYHAWIFMEG